MAPVGKELRSDVTETVPKILSNSGTYAKVGSGPGAFTEKTRETPGLECLPPTRQRTIVRRSHGIKVQP